MPMVAVTSLTTTEAALLALLAIEGEHTAYDLAKAVERAIGHIWSPARSGIFATLPRLAKDGLAERRGRRYRISRAGRSALDAWLETVERGARETFFLKVFVGGLTTPDVLLEHVAQFRADSEEQLAEYRSIARTNTNRGHDWHHRHLLRYAIDRAELDIAWADGVARALRRR
jgi:DNA-binding PadR family transcriptional regulator